MGCLDLCFRLELWTSLLQGKLYLHKIKPFQSEIFIVIVNGFFQFGISGAYVLKMFYADGSFGEYKS